MWYGQNPAVAHPRFVPLPIGLENRYNPYGRHLSVYAKLHAMARATPHSDRQGLLFANFNTRTNPVVRGAAARALSKFGAADGFLIEVGDAGKKPKRKDKSAALLAYGTRAMTYKYCACPPGHGLDTHRLWESLAVFACIPVVQRMPTVMPMLAGLPHLAVDDWSEVTPDRLRTHYASAAGTEYQLAKMYLPYWREELRRHLKSA
eukprot:TRINITY_DN16645_c0_g1_i2.p1 TRINITY_DN16645_c0_g1~~TRINITY_DN16645_c0_g1_i2.p1  ORF type:complete len:205 (+),score=27.14 TRINITY_DN16645_c0_g1_i2:722-1336(+)